MVAGEALLVWVFAASATLVPSTQVELAGRTVRIADVATLDGLGAAERSRVGGRILARLPEGRSSIELPRAALAALVRRAVPGLDVRTGGEGQLRLRIGAEPSQAGVEEAAAGCLALAAAVARGALLDPEAVEPALCEEGKAAAPVRYDRRHRVLRADADLPAGSYLGRLALPGKTAADRGSRLVLTSTAGPVQVEREVVAMQPARPGGRIFVRDEEGQTFAVPIAEAPKEEGP